MAQRPLAEGRREGEGKRGPCPRRLPALRDSGRLPLRLCRRVAIRRSQWPHNSPSPSPPPRRSLNPASELLTSTAAPCREHPARVRSGMHGGKQELHLAIQGPQPGQAAPSPSRSCCPAKGMCSVGRDILSTLPGRGEPGQCSCPPGSKEHFCRCRSTKTGTHRFPPSAPYRV